MQGSGTISETVQQEIMAHRNLYHPNILLFKKTILNSQALGIVVEYQAGGSLDAYIREAWPLQASQGFCTAHYVTRAHKHSANTCYMHELA